jgi:hypothetical protein
MFIDPNTLHHWLRSKGRTVLEGQESSCLPLLRTEPEVALQCFP